MNWRGFRLAALIIFCFFLFSLTILWLAKAYPIATESKDWLDMLAAIGEAAGIVALVGLVFEVIRREEEKKKQEIPIIKIGKNSIEHEEPPKNAICCLCEGLERDLPAKNENGDYREMWLLLNQKSKDHYLRIPIKNKQLELEGRAEKFRLKVQLEYSETRNLEDKRSITKIFWCPPNETSIPPGELVTIYVRCGKLNNEDYFYIKGEILDYECQNARGNLFIGSKMGFKPEKVYSQRLSRAELPSESDLEEE